MNPLNHFEFFPRLGCFQICLNENVKPKQIFKQQLKKRQSVEVISSDSSNVRFSLSQEIVKTRICTFTSTFPLSPLPFRRGSDRFCMGGSFTLACRDRSWPLTTRSRQSTWRWCWARKTFKPRCWSNFFLIPASFVLNQESLMKVSGYTLFCMNHVYEKVLRS